MVKFSIFVQKEIFVLTAIHMRDDFWNSNRVKTIYMPVLYNTTSTTISLNIKEVYKDKHSSETTNGVAVSDDMSQKFQW